MNNKKLELINVSGGFECELFNYGKMRDTIGHFNYNFSPGIYVLRGEFGMGGWALTEILCGREKNFSGKILFEEKAIDWMKLQEISCYVGDVMRIKGHRLFEKRTIHTQIDYAVNKGLAYGKRLDEVKEMFELSESRFERPIQQCSGERWRISMAVGYAFEKRIYCFPWVNGKFLQSLMCLELCLQHLLNTNAIVIIPTTFTKALDGIVESYSVVDICNC